MKRGDIKEILILLMIFFGLVFIFSLGGCGQVSSPDGTVEELPTPTCEVPPTEREGAQGGEGYLTAYRMYEFTIRNYRIPGVNEAVYRWNTALGINLLKLVDKDPWINIEVVETLGDNVLGTADLGFNSCTITIQVDYLEDWHVPAHEIGHCLGLDHVMDDDEAIMYYKRQRNSYITDAEVQLVKDRYPEIFNCED